ncbi:hypothetical protein ACHWQZ_G011199 [Mnemiopsis leidyi]
MSRPILLLVCLASLALICFAKKKTGKGGSKHNGNTEDTRLDAEVVANLEFENATESGTVEIYDEFSEFVGEFEQNVTSEFLRKTVDLSSPGRPSAANIGVYRTTRLVINLSMDVKNVSGVARSFRLRGTVDIYYDKEDPDAEETLILDSWGLKIKRSKVSYDEGVTFSDVEFRDHNQEDGSGFPKLELEVDPSQSKGIVRIEYVAPSAESLRYTSLEFMTFSDVQNYPMLVIFNTPDMARTWLPCQDSIHVKTPVDITISVPSPFTALSSGDLVSEVYTEDRSIFGFFQPISVAAQQISLTVGVMERWNISERVTVWMERRRTIRDGLLMEAEALLKICESWAGPFVWGHLDIVIIPDKIGYKGEMLGPNTIYLPSSFFETTSSPIQDDSMRVQELTRQIFYNWFGNLVTTPAYKSHGRPMVMGISEYLSYYATAQFLENDDQLANFFLLRAEEFVNHWDHDIKEAYFEVAYAVGDMRSVANVVGGPKILSNFFRMITLFSIADEFSTDMFWDTLAELHPEVRLEGTDDISLQSVEISSRYWTECQEIISAWNSTDGEPEIRAKQLKNLNYVQVAYLLENLWREELPKRVVREITSLLKKMEIYYDPNLFWRWAQTTFILGDTKLVEDALDYIKTYERNLGATTLLSILTETSVESKKVKKARKQIEASSYLSWN